MTTFSLKHGHWPEYLIEAWALGMFMCSAGLFTVLFEHPGAWLQHQIDIPLWRRAGIGLAMGFTAISLIYSPLGQRSGAHMNPAVTLTYWWLGRVTTRDAAGYISAQCMGGLAGVALIAALLGDAFTQAPVEFVSTRPGAYGQAIAFTAEFAIACGMMLTVLLTSSHSILKRYTGCFAGGLVALYITFEAPLSGMSMNPARTLASALPSGLWHGFWIYMTAPVAGMLSAAFMFRSFSPRATPCAKLIHRDAVRCIHCGLNPAPARASARGGNQHVH